MFFRKRPGKYIENTALTKRFRCIDGHQTKYITRAHFSSNEAWNDFLGMITYKNFQNRKNALKKWRTGKKIVSFKDLVKNLREEKASAADYLEVT